MMDGKVSAEIVHHRVPLVRPAKVEMAGVDKARARRYFGQWTGAARAFSREKWEAHG